MDDFLDGSQVPKLNQNQIKDLNSPINAKEREAVIKSLPNQKIHWIRWFSVEFYETFKGDLMLRLL